ncbi:mucin-associated surface protein (MASP), putative, partial [Trypanosoma cruzi]
MAMMMTGRVLLVCALCVLWCVTAGGRCDAGETAGSGSGGGRPPESKQLETSPQGTQGPKDEARSVEEKKPVTSSEDEAEEDDEEDNDDDEEKEKSKEKEDTPQAGKPKSSSKEVAATIPTASGLGGAGGGSPSGGVGGSSGSPNGSEDSNLEVPGPAVKSPPSLPNAAGGGLQNPDIVLSSQKNNFSETGVHSGTTLPTPSPPKPQAPAMPKPKQKSSPPLNRAQKVVQRQRRLQSEKRTYR